MKLFFVTPIGECGSETRRVADDVYVGLVKPVCERMGYEPIRADQLTSTAAIAQEILDHLDKDEMVVVDITEPNPNVYFELGYRFKTGKPLVLIRHAESKNPRPFDISGIRSCDYLLNPSSVGSSQFLMEKFIKASADAGESRLELSLDDAFVAHRLPNGSVSINLK